MNTHIFGWLILWALLLPALIFGTDFFIWGCNVAIALAILLAILETYRR